MSCIMPLSYPIRPEIIINIATCLNSNKTNIYFKTFHLFFKSFKTLFLYNILKKYKYFTLKYTYIFKVKKIWKNWELSRFLRRAHPHKEGKINDFSALHFLLLGIGAFSSCFKESSLLLEGRHNVHKKGPNVSILSCTFSFI